MFVGGVFVAAVYRKRGLKSNVRASSPLDSGLFFCVLCTLAEQAPRTAAWVRDTFGKRRFCCGKNEREGTPQWRRDREARSFRRSVAASPPRALPDPSAAGPDGCAVRARKARRKRERRPSGRACSHPWNPLSFSISLPKQVNPKTAFRVGFREGLWAPKPPP